MPREGLGPASRRAHAARRPWFGTYEGSCWAKAMVRTAVQRRSTDMEERRNGLMSGKTVLVTGATSGIGRATAVGLAKMGAHVAIAGRDRTRTEDTAVQIRAVGG